MSVVLPRIPNRSARISMAICALLVLVLAACGSAPDSNAAQPTPAAGPGGLSFPLRTPFLEFGANTHLLYTDQQRALTLANSAGFDWVRQPIYWKDIEGTPGNYAWGALDQMIDNSAAFNLKLLVSISQAPGFYNPTHGLPRETAPLGAFVEALARRYGNRIAAYEIWSHQNLAGENNGRVTAEDAGHYVEILAVCYQRIKAVAPEAYVLAGAASPTGINDPAIALSDEHYYQASYSYNDGMIKRFFDAQAVDLGTAANPPDTLWPDQPSAAPGRNDHPTFYFRHVENIRKLMDAAGLDDHQIWITAFGWATPNTSPGYEFGNQTSFEQQAGYLTGAIERAYRKYRDANDRPWVGVITVWNLNLAVVKGAEGLPNDQEAAFSILNPDWSPRLAYIALQDLLTLLKKAQGR